MSDPPGKIRTSAPAHNVMPLLIFNVDPGSTVMTTVVLLAFGHASRLRTFTLPVAITTLTTVCLEELPVIISALESRDGTFPPSQFVPTSHNWLLPRHSTEKHGVQHAMQATANKASILASALIIYSAMDTLVFAWVRVAAQLAGPFDRLPKTDDSCFFVALLHRARAGLALIKGLMSGEMMACEGQAGTRDGTRDEEGRTSPSGENEEERGNAGNDIPVSGPAVKKQRLGRGDHDIIL